MSPRVVAIIGATGTQGSAVLDAISADGTFTPRAVTRNPDSDKSKALKARGVEVVKGDLADKASVVKALQGSEAVFGVTNFWDPSVFPANPKGEIEQGKNLVDAAKEVGVKFFVWSSLPNASKLSNGKYTKILHLDYKAIVEEYLQGSGLPNATVYTGWFAENFWNYEAIKKTPTGYTIPVPKYDPTALQAVTWVARDLGPAVLALLKNYNVTGKSINGKTYPVIAAQISYTDMAKKISNALGGVEVTVTTPPTAGLEEIDEMFEYQSEIGLYRDTPVPNPDLVALGVKFSTFDELVQAELKKRFA